jgi:hypothetical protein
MLFDIIFISYNEPNADANYATLKQRFPYAKRLHGVVGIHQAHKQAALLAFTKNFWVVDGDSQVEESFKFKAPTPTRTDAVYVYRARNAVNNLEYGYGGIKLLPTDATLNMDVDSTDMTTSISENFIVVDELASVTHFNTDPYSTWRSAFRECTKLSSRIISNQVDQDTEHRMTTWCTLVEDVSYGFYAYMGALAGREYGVANQNNVDALKQINDFDWLEKEFNRVNFNNANRN